jgi:hypothetical protein
MAALEALMEEVAVNGLGARGPTLPTLETGVTRTRMDPVLPCVLFKAIGVVESDWKQFCGTGRTVISFDCGYGISQVTSGVSTYGPRVASEPAFNIGAGVSILLGKWNGDDPYGGTINDSNPRVVENWYYATWAYNGFTNGNNPNNPNLPANRPPFGGPGSLSRGSYPYQEIVWGRIRFPPLDGGEPRYAAVEVTYPNRADIPPPPSGTSLFQQDITIQPTHDNPCGDPCANGACPSPSTVIVDNLDPGFILESGMPVAAEAGGYNGGFVHAPSQPAGAPVVTARFVPTLPSDGIWEVSGWVPLTPATSGNIPVEVPALGGTVTWRMDHSVSGGVWQVLGSAKVRAGFSYARVRDDSAQPGEGVGLDAFRWRWVAFGGTTAPGGSCANSTECRDSLACLSGVCTAPCWEVACGTGLQCQQETGACVPGAGASSSVASSSVSAAATSASSTVSSTASASAASSAVSAAASASTSTLSTSSTSSSGGPVDSSTNAGGGGDAPPAPGNDRGFPRPPGCAHAALPQGAGSGWWWLGGAWVLLRNRLATRRRR